MLCTGFFVCVLLFFVCVLSLNTALSRVVVLLVTTICSLVPNVFFFLY